MGMIPILISKHRWPSDADSLIVARADNGVIGIDNNFHGTCRVI